MKKLNITQFKSKNGRLAKHKLCLLGLGIRRIHQTVTVDDTVENRGLINKISYMVRIEEIDHVS